VKRLPPNVSFYRRRLPDSVTHLNSPQGRVLFTEALRDGTMELYFPLSEQFMTQAEPAYCALSTLVRINASQ
jgi:glutathione gamma-glutamylcysteinyltransferase